MSNKQQLWIWLVAGIVVSLISSFLIGKYISERSSQFYYQDISQFIGEVHRQNPQLEEMIMTALKSNDPSNKEQGTDLLRQYGYTPQTFADQSSISLIMIIFAFSIGLFGVFVMYLLWFRYRNRHRIAQLTNYLYAINNGQESTLTLHREDDFSFLEDELYKTVVALREMRESAVQERKSLADNLADIAHQLKTPITSMSLMTELLAETRQDSEEDLIYVEKLHKQLERLNYLVSALLTLSKIDAGTLDLDKKNVDLFTLLTNALESIQDLSLQKYQTIIVQSEPAVSFVGDLHWCTEAILNLVKNCSEHTPAQGTINLSYEQNSIYTQILVEDNGNGFKKEDIPYLFERFYKGSNARKDSVGIGLALAKAIIEKHNGLIRAENKKEGGARFIVKFYHH